MPWKETRVSDHRMEFIVEYRDEEESMAELCRKFEISRKTGYKWLGRWRTEGPRGLEDRSRAPKTHPNQVRPDRVERILQLRDRYRWGPKKILALLEREGSGIDWPAISTIEDILRDHGRVVPRKKRRRVPPQTRPLAHAVGPNAVWCVDFKGEFLTGDGAWCYPLTISDACTRYLLRCQGLKQTGHDQVRPILQWAFRQYGLPQAIRSDNGPPFASRAVAGLSRLSVWWIKLGIAPDRIQPGHPEQNGRHERMHLTLQLETASPPARTFRKQQWRFHAFREQFNHVRPHEALNMDTPASRYVPSPRAYPARDPEIAYPGEWTVRRVQKRGEFYWRGEAVPLSEVLAGEPVGLEPVDGRYWRVYFGPVWLRAFDGYRGEVLTPGQARRRPDLIPPPRQPSPPRDAEDRPSATLQDDPPQV
jgi:putative transposase